MDGTRRAMRATYQREMDYLEAHMSFLATVGSVSPYVGLLGTVWGHHERIPRWPTCSRPRWPTVAPGIAEALVGTAIGLFAPSCRGGVQLLPREIDRLSPASTHS